MLKFLLVGACSKCMDKAIILATTQIAQHTYLFIGYAIQYTRVSALHYASKGRTLS